MDFAGQSVLAIAVAIALAVGAILGHMLMPVYVYVTVTVTEKITVTKTITVTGAQPRIVTNTSTPATPMFTLQNYKVVVYANKVSLLIVFKVDDNVNITLVGPDNTPLSSTIVKPSDNMVYLAMAPPNTSPKPGEYRLIVTSLDGVKIYEKTFEFQGPKLEILDVDFEVFWDNVVKGVIRRISIVVVNNGDMPAIVKKVVVQVDLRNYTIPIEMVMPIGKAKIDLVHATIAGLEKGSHKVTITLLDSSGLPLATYTVPVNIP